MVDHGTDRPWPTRCLRRGRVGGDGRARRRRTLPAVLRCPLPPATAGRPPADPAGPGPGGGPRATARSSSPTSPRTCARWGHRHADGERRVRGHRGWRRCASTTSARSAPGRRTSSGASSRSGTSCPRSRSGVWRLYLTGGALVSPSPPSASSWYPTITGISTMSVGLVPCRGGHPYRFWRLPSHKL